ncbi:chemotaxis protein CheA [Jannaschia sp. CCS1]|uniref:chemotaxis protein CheA n=1 Tax=Jannaschia sp. (strain CCS1) TaxID=290400 RepID=UPI000053AA89|nr:chemotaxis protein CheA [Jannaschia sp. CCS1]ABD55758.1 chemotaxis protein [Jannaschia sp. CCS1]
MTVGGSDEFRASFFEECEELLEAMHDGFGLMVNGEDDDETIHVVFRAVHSIKGGSGAFGLDDLVAFAHHFETALDRVRAGKTESSDDLLSLFQLCGDHLSDLVAAARNGDAVEPAQAEALSRQLDEVIGSPEDTDISETDAAETFEPLTFDFDAFDDPSSLPGIADDGAEDMRAGFNVTFVAEPELFSCGNEPALLFKALDRYGRVQVAADLDDVPSLSRLDPTMPYMKWSIDLETDATEDVIRDVFDFVSDCAVIDIAPLDRSGPPLSELPDPIADDGPGAVEPTLPQIAPVPPVQEAIVAKVEDTSAPPTPPESSPPQEVGASKPTAPDAAKTTAAPQTIRVDFERVDKLINLVGELVIKEAMLSQAVEKLNLTNGNDVLQEIEGLKQLAGEIQEGVMAIRAQPVKPLFQRMARTIRDASTTTGKRVRLTMKGEAAEVDKTVLERLVDPLNHMVRNAVDHGLESAEERIAAGKPAEGTVTLSAAHRSGRVVIEISDDGGGINRDKVRQHAESRGLVLPDATLTPSEVDALLFMPGFSMKEEVSELSGRGVGLDVVRSEISALGGRMSISSELGKGTDFSISLPLTLAVLEGMVVEVAGQTMVVPITAIQETLQPSTAQIHTIGSGGRVLSIRNTLVPIEDLGAIFGFRDTPMDLDDRVLLVIETETEKRCALIVDRLQDQRQVVIKSLETNYSHVSGIAAATILGDGRIALIVDPEDIAGGIALPQSCQTSAPDLIASEGDQHVAS